MTTLRLRDLTLAWDSGQFSEGGITKGSFNKSSDKDFVVLKSLSSVFSRNSVLIFVQAKHYSVFLGKVGEKLENEEEVETNLWHFRCFNEPDSKNVWG